MGFSFHKWCYFTDLQLAFRAINVSVSPWNYHQIPLKSPELPMDFRTNATAKTASSTSFRAPLGAEPRPGFLLVPRVCRPVNQLFMWYLLFVGLLPFLCISGGHEDINLMLLAYDVYLNGDVDLYQWCYKPTNIIRVMAMKSYLLWFLWQSLQLLLACEQNQI